MYLEYFSHRSDITEPKSGLPQSENLTNTENLSFHAYCNFNSARSWNVKITVLNGRMMATNCQNIIYSENQDGGGSHLEFPKFPHIYRYKRISNMFHT